MKLKIIFSLHLLLISVSAFSQLTTPEKQDQQSYVKAKVKSITATQIDYSEVRGKNVAGASFIVSKTGLDRNGNCILSKTYNKRGQLETWNTFDLEKDGAPKEAYAYNADGTLNVKANVVNTYDSLGRRSDEWTFLHDSVFISKTVFEYDKNGRLVQASTYEVYPNENDPSKVHLSSYERHKYDAKGRTIKVENYDSAGNLLNETIFKYAEDGRLAEKTIGYTGIYTYGTNGLCTSVRWQKDNGTLMYTVNYAYEFYSK
jgi:hypothetical protein